MSLHFALVGGVGWSHRSTGRRRWGSAPPPTPPPVSVIRTITVRRRWRSIPTYCWPT